MVIEGRALMPEDRIHDLTDALAEGETVEEPLPERPPTSETIYDLVDVVEKKPKLALVDPGLRDEIIRRVEEIAQQMAREMIPDIAEKVIRDEIEKLKKDS